MCVDIGLRAYAAVRRSVVSLSVASENQSLFLHLVKLRTLPAALRRTRNMAVVIEKQRKVFVELLLNKQDELELLIQGIAAQLFVKDTKRLQELMH